MRFENWKIERINDIRPDEFFAVIQKNKSHIGKTFPKTLEGCATLKKTFDFISNNAEIEKETNGYYFYIRNRETNALIGYVCIKKVDKAIRKCELAYFVDSEFEGQGIISKAITPILGFCFGELNMNKVIICTSKVNEASQRIAVKHGFQREGILREEFKSGDGNLEDIVYWGLLKSEYSNER